MFCVYCGFEFSSVANYCANCGAAKLSEHDTSVLIPAASPYTQPQNTQAFTPTNNIFNHIPTTTEGFYKFRRILLLCIIANLITIILITLQSDLFFWNSESHERSEINEMFFLVLLPFFTFIVRFVCPILGIIALKLKKRIRCKSVETTLTSTFSIIAPALIIINLIVSIVIILILVLALFTLVFYVLYYDTLQGFRVQFGIWANRLAYLSHIFAFLFGLLAYFKTRTGLLISPD